MLPFDYQLTIKTPHPGLSDRDGFIGRLLRRISAMLVDVEVSNILLTEGNLEFDVALFRRVWTSWNLLIPVDKGRIQAEYANGCLKLSYWISFQRMFIITTIAVLMMGIIAWAQDFPPLAVVTILIGGWLWLYGMGVVIFLLRFNSFLKRGVREEIRYEKMR